MNADEASKTKGSLADAWEMVNFQVLETDNQEQHPSCPQVYSTLSAEPQISS